MKIPGTRSIILWPILLISCQQMSAQELKNSMILPRFYASVSGGYGNGINGSYVYSSSDYQIHANQLKTGKGFYGSAAIGYQATENIGFELAAGFFSGMENTYIPVFQPRFSINSGKYGYVAPSIIFSTYTGIFRPYIKAGLLFAKPEFYTNMQFYEQTITDKKVKYYGGGAIGLQNSLGVTIFLKNTHFQLFAETSFNTLSYLPQHASLYLYTISGADKLGYFAKK